ncbi:MAG TPA: hypothetical protein VMS09_00925 [Paenibacillus sp.]|nr:hypothetical protein [Paenibacillus sp.]HUC90570.1 hypothetical protein [Paenibacillus sp.]
MPVNRSQTVKHQQNNKSVKETARTVQPEKAADRPPELNGIEKQLP